MNGALVLAENENGRVERRRDARVIANGSAIVRGAVIARGRVANVSSGGACVRLSDGEPRGTLGDDVELELHLDRAGASWLRLDGRILRTDDRGIAIGFTAVPIAFADVLQDALVSALEGAAVAHVLLVDADPERRASFAALLRRAECNVVESSTPLEAIAHLGGSSIESWVVAISDSVPAGIAKELRRFLAGADVQVDVVALGTLSPTVAVARLFSTRPV